MKTILVATDLSARADRALSRAIEIAEAQGARLVVLHVIDEDMPDAVQAALRAAARSRLDEVIASVSGGSLAFVRPELEVTAGHPIGVLLDGARRHAADLVVLGIARQTAWDMFIGSTADRLIRLGETPVLVVREPVARAYEKVLAAVDLSEHSRAALDLAASLARQGTVRVLHVIHMPFTGFMGADTLARFERDERDRVSQALGAQIDGLRAALGDKAPVFQVMVKDGETVATVTRVAQEIGADLVCLGAHSRSGLSYAMVGSVAASLLADPPADMLVVKAPRVRA